jgi:hypothetical protein
MRATAGTALTAALRGATERLKNPGTLGRITGTSPALATKPTWFGSISTSPAPVRMKVLPVLTLL